MQYMRNQNCSPVCSPTLHRIPIDLTLQQYAPAKTGRRLWCPELPGRRYPHPPKPARTKIRGTGRFPALMRQTLKAPLPRQARRHQHQHGGVVAQGCDR